MMLIKVVGFANGQSCPIAGQYLRSMDFEAYGGKGFALFTHDPKMAKKFETAGQAFEFWRRSPTCKPRLEDGQPNRPLTSTTIEICPEPVSEHHQTYPSGHLTGSAPR
jgi:hypothetical protein